MNKQIRTLYKYVSLENEKENSRVQKLLNNQQLYLSNGKNFNDPFDLAVVSGQGKGYRKAEGLHILCLTKSYRKKLMWSHYAQSHKGICLTVKIDKNMVYPVCYTSKRVKEDSDIDAILHERKKKGETEDNDNYSTLSKNKKIAYIKDKKWMDEREYRAVFDKDDERLLRHEGSDYFLPVRITNVYLGVRFDENDEAVKNSIIEICKQQKIEIRQMVMDLKQYAINPKKI